MTEQERTDRWNAEVQAELDRDARISVETLKHRATWHGRDRWMPIRTLELRALLSVVDAAQALRGKLEGWESTPELDAALARFCPARWDEPERPLTAQQKAELAADRAREETA